MSRRSRDELEAAAREFFLSQHPGRVVEAVEVIVQAVRVDWTEGERQGSRYILVEQLPPSRGG